MTLLAPEQLAELKALRPKSIRVPRHLQTPFMNALEDLAPALIAAAERCAELEKRIAELDRATDIAIQINNYNVAEIEKAEVERDRLKALAVRLAKDCRALRLSGVDRGCDCDQCLELIEAYNDWADANPDIAALLDPGQTKETGNG